MTRPRGYVRLIAALLLLAVAGAAFPPGVCLMQRGSARASSEGAHDCCAAGIGAATPACCHSDATLGPKAVLGAQSSKAIVLAAASLAWASPTLEWRPERALSASPHSTHSPPPTILRI